MRRANCSDNEKDTRYLVVCCVLKDFVANDRPNLAKVSAQLGVKVKTPNEPVRHHTNIEFVLLILVKIRLKPICQSMQGL